MVVVVLLVGIVVLLVRVVGCFSVGISLFAQVVLVVVSAVLRLVADFGICPCQECCR